MRRIDEWLAEGIDIDADGQFTERSTLTYNVVTDRALLVMAAKLGRPALLEPVRRNLHALAYLLHADGEVVTEISRRQDQYTRGGVAGYWFPLTWLAVADGIGGSPRWRGRPPMGRACRRCWSIPNCRSRCPSSDALPDDYEHPFPELGIVRIRRGPPVPRSFSAARAALLTLRRGAAVIEGVRFATPFFGKGQFIPDSAGQRGGTYWLRQALEAPYYQPLGGRSRRRRGPPRAPSGGRARSVASSRAAEITETSGGFQLRLPLTARPACRWRWRSDFARAAS